MFYEMIQSPDHLGLKPASVNSYLCDPDLGFIVLRVEIIEFYFMELP